MSAKTEGRNPFDKYLPPDKKQEADEMWATRNFQEVQEKVQRSTEEGFELAELHEDQWVRHHQRLHKERLEEAEELVPVEVREKLHPEQEDQDRLDDERFAWITCYDQLLLLNDHEEYLRARRSLERRLQQAREAGESLPTPWTAGRIWVVITLVATLLLVVSAMSADPVGGFIVACILIPIWALLARIPSFFSGTGSGSYGRGGGNAV
jgi:hypothetical protein